MKKLSLPHTPIPFNNEFAASYLLRISFSNGYQSPKQMLNNAGISIYKLSYDSVFTDEKKWKEVLEHLNISEILSDLIIKKVPPTFQYFFWNTYQTISPSLLVMALNKFCPICLKNNMFWNKNWLLTPLTVCLEHHVNLITNCPSCYTKMSSNRRSLFECPNCKFDLRMSESQPSSKDDIESNEWFSATLLSKIENFTETYFNIWNALIDYYSNLDLAINYAYILKLCYQYSTSQEEFTSTIINIIEKNLNYAHPRIQILPFLKIKSNFSYVLGKIQLHFKNYNIFSYQPTKKIFNKNDTIQILGTNFSSFNKRLKAGILFHENLVKNERLNFTVEIIENWLINDSRSINGCFEYNPPPICIDQSEDYFDIHKISQLLNINIDTTRKFLKSPNIPTTKKYLNKHTKFCLSKDFLVDFNDKYIFLSSLAKLLKVSPVTLNSKISSLGIQPIFENSLYPAYYAKKDVNHLTASMLNEISVYPNNFGRKRIGTTAIGSKSSLFIKLKEASRLLNLTPLQTAQLIQHKWLKVESLDVHPYQISIKSVNKLLQQINDPSFIDIGTVLSSFNCTFNQLQKNWIMTGYLKLRHIGYWRSVPREQFEYVLKIRKEFFTASEANAYLGMHRTHITNLVTQGLIKPHLYGNHNYSVRLFKKIDVEKLLKSGHGKIVYSELSK